MSHSEQRYDSSVTITILLVEDSPGDQRLVEMGLAAGQGGIPYQLLTAESLSDGIAILSKEPVDVVLLDLHLPDSQGFETFSALFKKFPQLPIVVLSNKGSEELAIATVAHGAQDYLSKELIIDSYWLFRTIRYAMGRAQLRNELDKAKEEAEKLARLKADFVAMVSHEIRTPINGIIGMTSLLLRSDLSSEQRERLEIVKLSGDSLLGIINDILDISKVDAGKIQLEEQDVSLGNLLAQTLQLFQCQINHKPVTLHLDVDPNLPSIIHVDPSRLRQILFNLIGNAAKFTHQGSVRVTARKELKEGALPYIRIEVIDTGIGIPSETFDKLFIPFSQADSSTTRRYGGTGLGLAISKRLAEIMGGEMGFSSSPGQGSVFWFLFPLTQGKELTPAGSEDEDIGMRSTELPLARRKKEEREEWILLAEDNPINQKIAAQMVKELGYKVDVVSSGWDAIRAIQQAKYSAILMDCQMPNLDGYEATRRIRNLNGDLGRIPIIALTAYAMAGDREKCIAAQMNDYLSKPILFEALDKKLSLWVRPRKDPPAVVDAEILSSLRALDREDPPNFMNKIIDMFISLTPPLLEELKTSVMRGEIERVRRLAHKLRGSSANLGASSMENFCARLEKWDGQPPSHGGSLVNQIEAEYSAVKEILERDWRMRELQRQDLPG